MASLAELARLRTDLDGPKLAHLQRLVGAWGLLADFCFADLLLFAPERGSGGTSFVVLGQIRPATTQTVYRSDLVGTLQSAEERPIVANSFRLGEIVETETTISPLKERIRVLAIPVRWEGEIIGVLTRESALAFGRQPGELERTYVEIFNRFARMISAGEFPFAAEDPEPEEAPRVGDGVILLDAQSRVAYTSPNAVSALHRVGIHANTEGMRLGEVGLDDSAILAAMSKPKPVIQEIEQGPEITVLLRCIPLLDSHELSGAVVLLRDISELRRRDRLLISKDATIQEIHHRVKNNLQTVASLLRLQSRAVGVDPKEALEHSVNRILAIAAVHEVLTEQRDEDVELAELIDRLRAMLVQGLAAGRAVEAHLEQVSLAGSRATALALVFSELLQNALEHGAGSVSIELGRRNGDIVLAIADEGAGPEGAAEGTGLSIVSALVRDELQGSFALLADRGTRAEVVFPG
jgi:two-component sensor histidine kinase